MSTVLWIGGIFNIVDPVLGFPLYIWSWVGLTVFAIFAYLGWYFGGWKPYLPLHGLYWAWKHGSNAAFIFDANLIGEMVDEKTAKCIFDYSKEEYELELPEWIPTLLKGIASWVYSKISYYPTAYLDNIDPLHAIVYKFGGVNKDVEIARRLQKGEWERSPSVVCGGVPVDIIVDADNWTIKTSPQHKAIERCARIWNDANPDDRIESYSKFQRYLYPYYDSKGNLQTARITCPEVKSDITVSWTRIDAGFPLDLEESEWAGKRRQMAEQEYNAKEMSMNKLALYVLFGGLGISALMILIRFAVFLVNHHG